MSTSPESYTRLAQGIVLNTPISTPANDTVVAVEHRVSSRSSQEPDETRFEGHYIGPTSGIAFLHRAQRRFKQDFVNTNSINLENNGASQPSVFKFGDGHLPDPSSVHLKFPARYDAKQLLDRYFEFAMPTYRFLDRTTSDTWLENLCDEYEDRVQSQQPLSNAKAAIVLLILATSTLYGESSDRLPRAGGGGDVESR